MTDFTFEFEDLTFDEVEESRKRKQVERDTATQIKDWMTAFNTSGKPIGGRFTWNTLPAPIAEAFAPTTSKTGNRVLGGMQAITRKIKDFQDDLDVYPVPMDDAAIHTLNGERGEDMTADDPRYGGFILVRKSAWKNRNVTEVAPAKNSK